MDLAQLALAASVSAAVLAAVMAVAWRLQQRLGSSRWVDSTWSVAVGIVATAGALSPLAGEPPAWRQVMIGSVALLWCIRLGAHIARRNAGADDPRYRKLMQDWGSAAPRRMFWFLQSQAAVGALLASAVVLAAHHPAPSLRFFDVAGIALVLFGLAGEAAADRQLSRFKQDPANRRRVCDVGLWGATRHPNYFFEWLVWLGYAVVALDVAGNYPQGFLALAAPAVMYWVLRHASGVPPLEQHMLETRGRAFRDYQAKVPPFFPRLWRRSG
jgi:steroid 5-alpha reductase family enzyme